MCHLLKLLTFIVMFYFIIVEVSTEIGLKTSDYNISEAVVTIIKKCFPKNPRTVILAGNWSNMHDVHQRVSKTMVVGILERSKSLLQPRSFNKKIYDFRLEDANMFAQPAPIILIEEAGLDHHKLRQTLELLRNSTWWNHEGFFLIVYDDCEKIAKGLETAWDFDLLYVVCLCKDINKGITAYAFNPYTNYAPPCWKRVKTIYGRYQHAIVLFRQTYVPNDKSFCKELNFDKTSTLGSYPIKLCAAEQNFVLTIDPSKRGLERYAGASSEFTRVLWNKLNASLIITEYTSLGYVDEHGLPTDMLADIVFGKQDIGMNGRWQRFFWKEQTVPYDVERICIITRNQGQIQMFEKMMVIIQPRICLAIGCLFILSMFFLKHAIETNLTAAAFEELRMLLVSATLYVPSVGYKKIIFIMMIFIHGIINSYFQTRLSALSSVSPPRRNIDSEKDLIDSNFTIYGRQEYREYLITSIPNDRYRVCHIHDCIKWLKMGKSVACVEGCNMLQATFVDKEVLHIAKHYMRHFFVVFVTRENWPLHQRVNTEILKMIEAGLYTFFKRRELSNLTKYPNHPYKENNSKYSALTLEQMNFGFGFFAFGILFSIFIFMLELIFDKCQHFICNFKRNYSSISGEMQPYLN